MLESDLAYFDSRGFPFTGTSTHSDRLCRTLNFRNWELFKEWCDGRFGGPRTITYTVSNGDAHTVRLGAYPMFDFGLEYEACDIAPDVYITDSGGKLGVRKDTVGRRSLGRDGKRGQVVRVLTHPVRWQF